MLSRQRAMGLTQELVNARIRATTLQTKWARDVSTWGKKGWAVRKKQFIVQKSEVCQCISYIQKGKYFYLISYIVIKWDKL